MFSRVLEEVESLLMPTGFHYHFVMKLLPFLLALTSSTSDYIVAPGALHALLKKWSLLYPGKETLSTMLLAEQNRLVPRSVVSVLDHLVLQQYVTAPSFSLTLKQYGHYALALLDTKQNFSWQSVQD